MMKRRRQGKAAKATEADTPVIATAVTKVKNQTKSKRQKTDIKSCSGSQTKKPNKTRNSKNGNCSSSITHPNNLISSKTNKSTVTEVSDLNTVPKVKESRKTNQRGRKNTENPSSSTMSDQSDSENSLTDSESEYDTLEEESSTENDMTEVLNQHSSFITGNDSRNVYGEPTLEVPMSTPISSQINKSLKKKIWQNAYIDMADLLPATPHTGHTNGQFSLKLGHNSQFTITPTAKAQKINSIEVWSTAFIRFVAIYTEKFPTLTPDFMKYFEIVRDIASRRGGLAWQTYDTQFRLLKAQSNIPWHVMHYELWLRACTDPLPMPIQPRPFRTQPFQSFPSQHNRSWQRGKTTSSQPRFWTKTCWPFNRGECHSTSCTLPHICGFCKGSHSAGHCSFRNREQAAQAMLGQPQGRLPQFNHNAQGKNPRPPSDSHKGKTPL
ncbi:uncharacterized protein LOC128549694 [Mercenaria mercenaria]|uniref:uncharacterized protein LOC128549694 n=1 Tax=Mercenaria mercenaria TaxID=6596 RepID=UPI00234EAD00|nr:uncharacterized protein LOC128549694 [Mercenaria mercenaria]